MNHHQGVFSSLLSILAYQAGIFLSIFPAPADIISGIILAAITAVTAFFSNRLLYKFFPKKKEGKE